jgi:hypothetical protein
MVEESDFNINDYEHKLNIFTAARRNQLQSELLSVKILSDVQQSLEEVEDLLRPWL